MHHFCAIRYDGILFELSDQDAFQIKTVLRLKSEERIVCIYEGMQYLCAIKYIGKERTMQIVALEKLDVNRELKAQITLVMGLIRGPKWDLTLQKATELGVSRIVPFQFKRSVVQLDQSRTENKTARWTRICKEASEQSRRNVVPEILPLLSKIDALKDYMGDLNLVAYEKEQNQELLSAIFHDKFCKAVLVIGPEGGFDPDEIVALESLGFFCVSLGKAILRAETACFFGLALLKACCEQQTERN